MSSWLFFRSETIRTPLIVAETAYGDVQNLVAVQGTLKPSHTVEVGAQVSGQIETLYAWEGKKVKEGELVAQIDATVQRARVEEQSARLRAQEAQLASHNSKLSLAMSNAERYARLLAADATSQVSFDRAQDQLVSWESSLVRLQSEIEQSRASLASEEALLGYSRIYAPINGTVVEVRVSEGQTVIATQQVPVIMVIAHLDTMLVEASVSEADMSRIEPGMETYLETVSGGLRRWETKLGQILPNPRVDDNVVRFTTLFRVDNADGALLPNMTAQVFIVTSSAKNVLVVPYEALVTEKNALSGGGVSTRRNEWGAPAQVRLPLDDGGFELRDIEVGVTSRVSAEVLSGLQEGDTVVVGRL